MKNKKPQIFQIMKYPYPHWLRSQKRRCFSNIGMWYSSCPRSNLFIRLAALRRVLLLRDTCAVQTVRLAWVFPADMTHQPLSHPQQLWTKRFQQSWTQRCSASGPWYFSLWCTHLQVCLYVHKSLCLCVSVHTASTVSPTDRTDYVTLVQSFYTLTKFTLG